ncbi:MAG: hypothetical protein CSA49_01350 [Gammaproteobacteria bacterium]|nr:MAG: hypothetical protein CSA49_01350 [Gammaproteobacteria bacterium]
MTTPPLFDQDPFDQGLALLFDNIQSLPNGQSLVLTPNKRLSRFLNEQFNRYQSLLAQQGSQQNAWTTLNCHSFHGWIQQQWDTISTAGQHPLAERIPLTGFQETTLWESVINEHSDTPPLLAVPATVKLAQNAWRLMHEWHLDLNQYHDNNTLLFLAWCQAFQKVCAEKQMLTAVQQVNIVIEATQNSNIKVPDTVFLYGFDELTPQMVSLIEALQDRSVNIEQTDIQYTAAQPTRRKFPDIDHEIEAAALWAKEKWTQQKQETETTVPDKIAIVVPNLAQLQEKVERIFTRVFEPQALLPETPQHAPGFNLSAATPLSQVPMINIALQILNCHQQWIDIETVSQLLRSPFAGIMAEQDSRALLDGAIRGHEFEISLKQLKTALGKTVSPLQGSADGPMACPDFYQRVSEFERLSQQHRRQTLYPSQWIEAVNAQLCAMGWPGNRPLDTIEYQQLQAWRDNLNVFAGLDHLTGKISLTAAIKHLSRLMAQASFKAQTKDSPVQILGILEAAGLPFSAIWFMNLDDETWPPAPNPNPLIPVALQVARQLPQSAADRELFYAKRLTQRLIHSTHDIVFSYATSKEGQPLQPSPLIASAQPVDSAPLAQPVDYASLLYKNTPLETSWDHCGPHVKDIGSIRGGSQLLQDQAACPFRAFARHRLHSEGIPDINIGLDARERGNLLHHALEIIWKKLRNQQRLLQLDGEAQAALIHTAIDTAMQGIKSKRFIGERFIAIETRRLSQQIHQWLELEKQRSDFQVVLNEGKRTVKLGQLPIRIRYDRVDRLADGSLFVLDYKTGTPTIQSWSSERPDEPQVPLYCIANQGKVSGAAFGQVNAKKVAIIGVATDTSVAPGLETIDKITISHSTDNWDTALAQWRAVLEKLANEFMAGSAEVNPKKPHATCTFCELAALCRIKDQFTENDLAPQPDTPKHLHEQNSHE